MSTSCSALNNAIRAKGITIPQLAQNVGSTQERVTKIVTGQERATQQEFTSLARALDIQSPPPSDSAHTTR